MTTEKPSVSWAIAFKKEEIALMRTTLIFESLTPWMGWQPQQFMPAKEDELVALNTFKEFKKSFKKDDKWNEIITDCELEFGTEQKALLIKRVESFKVWVWDLETKYSILEKLK